MLQLRPFVIPKGRRCAKMVLFSTISQLFTSPAIAIGNCFVVFSVDALAFYHRGINVISSHSYNFIFAEFESNACKIVWFRYMYRSRVFCAVFVQN